MATGMWIGAWLYVKKGPALFWFGFAVAALLGIADFLWGQQLGRALGTAVRGWLT